MTHADERSTDETDLVVTHVKSYAAGIPAVAVSLGRGLEQMGVLRTARTLLKLNQRNGFDCPGCAWPETPGHRKHAEFCENGAKAVAEEATTRTVTPSFFAAHSVSELLEGTSPTPSSGSCAASWERRRAVGLNRFAPGHSMAASKDEVSPSFLSRTKPGSTERRLSVRKR
jgi:hypothetical protein